MPFNPYFGYAVWPPPTGLSHSEFTHGTVSLQRIDDSTVEAQFDFSGQVTFELVPGWVGTSSGRVALYLVHVQGQWTVKDSRLVHAQQVFGREGDDIPSLEISDLTLEGDGAPDNLAIRADLSVKFDVSDLQGEWDSNLIGDMYITSLSGTVQIDGCNAPERSGNTFTSVSAYTPEAQGIYWVFVSAFSMKTVDGCMLPIGTWACGSTTFTVARD